MKSWQQLAPLLFLFLLVPFGAFLVPALQTFTTRFTVHGLQLLGIPVFALLRGRSSQPASS